MAMIGKVWGRELGSSGVLQQVKGYRKNLWQIGAMGGVLGLPICP